MVYRENLDKFPPYPVYDPVVAKNGLAKERVSRLWNDSPGVGKAPDPFNDGEDIHHEQACLVRRVLGYAFGEGLEIVRRLRRPPYFSHFAILSFTCGWATVWPESAC